MPNFYETTPSKPSPARLAELEAMTGRAYKEEYLNTPEWEITRNWALERLGKRCTRLDGCKGPQQVHHQTYKRLGRERLSDLIVLCDRHHEEVEADERRRKGEKKGLSTRK